MSLGFTIPTACAGVISSRRTTPSASFRVLRNAVIKHMKTHALPEDELEDVWWRHITRLMKTLVDGFHFDKSPEAFQKARMGAFGSGVPVAGVEWRRGGAP